MQLCVGLVLALVLGCMTTAEPSVGLALVPASVAPSYERGDLPPLAPEELSAFEEAEEEENEESEDGAASERLFASSRTPDLVAPRPLVGALADVLAAERRELWVSTGLGRGPPLG